jgi:23S rRNA pseudouridine2605 synthase
MELIESGDRRLYPVGRLDKDSRGLLLMTDDGDLAHQLLHPSFGAEKVYEVRVRGVFGQAEFEKLAKGVMLEDGMTLPARVEEAGSDGEKKSRFRIAIREGRKRQIRLMVRALGGHVSDLRRVAFAGLELGSLPEGSWRALRPGEIRALKGRLVESAKKGGARGGSSRRGAGHAKKDDGEQGD